MSDTVIKVENLSKLYRLGEVGTGTLSHDLNRWWAGIRGKEDPFLKVGKVNDRTVKAAKGEHVWAIKDINFEVKQGEVLGIIGKNGAGKSTLLKILSRITAPTTGEIKIKGRVGSLLEVGTGFHPEMTGRENIYMNGTILGMTRREISAKLDDIVDFAGIAKFLDTPVKRFSSGMMVRLGFAVAAFLEPEILIVDEVLAVGDAEFQKRAIGKMQDISQKGGRTVLFVSHNMSTIKSICDKGFLIKNGISTYLGNVHKTIEHYLSESKFSVTNKHSKINGFDLVDFRFENFNSNNRDIYSGCKVRINFTIHGSYNNDKPLIIGWISNHYGDKLLLLSTRLVGTSVMEFKNKIFVEIILNSLMVMSGSYFFNVGLLTSAGKPVSYWHNIDTIDVFRNPNDIQLSLPDIPNRGIVYSSYSIKIKND